VPPTRPRRRLRRIVTALACVIGVGLILFFLLFPTIGRWAIRSRVLPRVAAKLGRDVRVDSIRVGYGDVVLEGVTISGPSDDRDAPLLKVGKVSADFDFWPALVGDVRIHRMTVDGAAVRLVRNADGADNFGDLIARLRGGDGGRAERDATMGSRLMPAEVVLTGGSLSYVDAQGGMTAAVTKIEGQATRGAQAQLTLGDATAALQIGPRVSAQAITVTSDLSNPARPFNLTVAGGAATPLPTLSLTGITGSIESPGGDERAKIGFRGGYGGVEGDLWHAEGWASPSLEEADLHLRADRFTLDKLARILAGTPVQEPEKTAVSASLDLTLRGNELAFSGGIDVSGLRLYHELAAEEPVKDLGFEGTIRGRVDRRGRLFTLEQLGVAFRGIDVRLDGYAALPGGREEDGTVRIRPRLKAHLNVPQVTCQQALEAIPPAYAPRLQGFKLKGKFKTDLTVEVDWADLEALVLSGSVGIFGCKVLEAPESLDAKRLEEEFEHFVEVEEDNWISFLVGPSNPDFVPLADVSPHLISSLMTTEDNGFFKHKGFISREFKSALIKNLQAGHFKYGASSITMQLVKNVLLYREKTLSRKLQELFLTWYIETVLPKERIMEMYVNVIEFGPGIYGVGPAARHYFGKHPRDLNPVESAFFSSILPSPKRRYMQYCEGELNRWGDAKVQRILKTMRERDRLTDEELQAALATPLIFDRTRALPEKECKEMTRRMIKKARPTTPPKKGNVPDEKGRRKKKKTTQYVAPRPAL
jgi:hypothetical protein